MASMNKFINGEDFSAQDLDIFADSIETLARIERDRHLRRQNRRVSKRSTVRRTIEAEIHPNIDFRALEAEDIKRHSRPVCAKQLRCKLFQSISDISAMHSSDENYYSAASSVESPTGGSKESLDMEGISSFPSSEEFLEIEGISSLPSTDSGTESESGFRTHRPRSNAMDHCAKARIIGLTMKKEFANRASMTDISKTPGEEVLMGLMREKEKYERLLETVQKQKASGSDLKTISKALSWLSL